MTAPVPTITWEQPCYFGCGNIVTVTATSQPSTGWLCAPCSADLRRRTEPPDETANEGRTAT